MKIHDMANVDRFGFCYFECFIIKYLFEFCIIRCEFFRTDHTMSDRGSCFLSDDFIVQIEISLGAQVIERLDVQIRDSARQI